MKSSFKPFLIALAIVILVLVLVALPSALIETYGLKTKKLMLLIDGVVLAVFSLAMLVWWVVRYRKTGQRIESLGEKIERISSPQRSVEGE